MADQINDSRRNFLSKAAIAGSITLAPGVLLHQTAHAKPDDQAVSSDVRWGMLIDTEKCAKGCTGCVDACNEEFDLIGSMPKSSEAQKTQYIRKVSLVEKQTKHEISLPMLCQHCENPPCVDVCPTGASFKRVDGIVLVDKHICIGCRYCMMACPYKARSFVHEAIENQTLAAPRGKGTVESCTMCVHRVDKGEIPACVEACTADNHNAMLFGDINDPDSEISREMKKHGGKQIRADLKLNTGVRYQGL
ncbi:MAG: 4Fe-4S dicluster domain-containing protein [Gammaproteobacteria bacterium]|nr:4Fe-4S dicluster domain-containing protein [Gammaproteobacteria bacterium]